jgi:hypothetical protein
MLLAHEFRARPSPLGGISRGFEKLVSAIERVADCASGDASTWNEPMDL